MKARVLQTERIGGVFRYPGEIIKLKDDTLAGSLAAAGVIEIISGEITPAISNIVVESPKKPAVRLIPWVVIPTYNRCLEIIQQIERIKPGVTRLNGRIIVVNDGSTDNTAARLVDGGIISVISYKKNRGVGYARRLGTGLVPDDAIVIELDDHDILTDGAIEKLLNAFDEKTHLVYTDCTLKSDRAERAFPKPDYTPGLFRQDCWAIGVRAYRKSTYTTVGGYKEDEFPAEDYALFLRMELYLNDAGFKRLPENLCTVKMTGDSISAKYSPELEANAVRFRSIAKQRADSGERGFETLILPEIKKTGEEIAVIMATADRPDLAFPAIESIEKYTKNYKLIFIAHGDVSFRDKLFNHGEVIQWDKGFNMSAMNNAGIKAAGRRDVIICNSDIEVTEGWLEKMTDIPYGISNPRTDRGACCLKDSWTAGDLQRTAEVMPFFCTYIPRAVIDKVGLCDERFTFYGGDDTDFCIRCNRHRIPMWISEAFVHHKKNGTWGDAYRDAMKPTNELLKKKWGVDHLHVEDMYEKSLVTVAMPGYNCEKWADQAIESIVNQSYRDLEIVIVDDCSTDNTPYIIEEWARKDKRIVFIRNTKRLYAPTNRNLVYDYANGEFVANLDLDDYCDTDRIETMLKYFSRNPETDVLYTDYLRFENTLESGAPVIAGLWDRDRALSGRGWPGGAALMCRRWAYDNIGGYDTNLLGVGDGDWMLRADEAGLVLGYLPGLSYYARKYDGVMSSSKTASASWGKMKKKWEWKK